MSLPNTDDKAWYGNDFGMFVIFYEINMTNEVHERQRKDTVCKTLSPPQNIKQLQERQ